MEDTLSNFHKLTVEQRTFNPLVASSILARPTTQNAFTIRDLAALWLEHAQDKRSINDDATRLTNLIMLMGADTEIGSLRPFHIERVRRGLQAIVTRTGRPMKPASVNRHLALLRSALKCASANEYISNNPMRGVKFLKEHNVRDRICTPQEYKQLTESAHYKLQAVIHIGYHTGMRLGEICGLRWDQIDFNRRVLRLQSAETKEGAPRVVPLSETLVGIVRRTPRISDKVVDTKSGTVSPAFARLCKKLGIRDLRFHDLRHTYATNLRRAGVDILTIAKLLGHKTLVMVQRYNTIDIQDLHEAVARLHIRGTEHSAPYTPP